MLTVSFCIRNPFSALYHNGFKLRGGAERGFVNVLCVSRVLWRRESQTEIPHMSSHSLPQLHHSRSFSLFISSFAKYWHFLPSIRQCSLHAIVSFAPSARWSVPSQRQVLKDSSPICMLSPLLNCGRTIGSNFHIFNFDNKIYLFVHFKFK